MVFDSFPSGGTSRALLSSRHYVLTHRRQSVRSCVAGGANWRAVRCVEHTVTSGFTDGYLLSSSRRGHAY